ncbi:MAG: alginate O-acetyltransferase AlgX-related protein [Phycisphaerae bacterium]
MDTHPFRNIWRVSGVLLCLAVLAGGCGDGNDTSPNDGNAKAVGNAPPSAEKQRELAIAATAAAIDADVQAHGGSWEAWKQQTAPFREDLKRITRGKWPWPAKKNFRFLGRAARLLMLESWQNRPPDHRPWETIVHLNQQLRARGIDLVFVAIPDKIATYPDYISAKAPADRAVSWQARKLLRKLCREGVEVIDLYPTFRTERRKLGEDKPLFYDRDSHWRNRGAVLAAERIAARLKRYPFVREALADGSPYALREHTRTDGSKADEVLVVVEKQSGKPYRADPRSRVVLTGDSFAMYNMHLNGHLPAHVAHGIGLPLTFVAQEGLAQRVPVELASRQKRGDFLDGRRVLVWVVRGRSLVEKNWQPADLPGKPSTARPERVRGKRATGKVVATSAAPDKDSEYPDYVMKLQVTDLVDADGWTIRDGSAVVRVLAMKDRRIRSAAGIEPGQTVTLELTTWSAMEPVWGTTRTGGLPDVESETDLPQYWGELP